MLYGIKQANNEYNERIGEEIGATGYEIDYHSNSRPTHRFMQGRQFASESQKQSMESILMVWKIQGIPKAERT